MGHDFQQLEENDLPAVFELTRRAGLNQNMEETTWSARAKWSWFDSRKLVDGAPPAGLVARTNGRLSGFVGYSFRRFRCRDEIVNGVALSDYAVDPGMRGLLGLMLNRRTIEDFENRSRRYVILGLHHTEAAARIWERFGARAVPQSNESYVALISPARFLTARLPALRPVVALSDRAGIAAGLARLVLGQDRMKVPALPEGIRLTGIEGLDGLDGLDGLLDRYMGMHDVAVVRDAEYLKWRYLEHPSSRYDITAVMRGANLAGLIVLKIETDGTCYLYEAIHDDNIDGGADVVTAAVVRRAVQLGASQLFAKMTSPATASAMIRAGFKRTAKSHDQFWVYPEGPAGANPVYSFGDFRDN